VTLVLSGQRQGIASKTPEMINGGGPFSAYMQEHAIVELQRIVERLQRLVVRCGEGLLRKGELMQDVHDVEAKMEQVIPRDADAFRVFDRKRLEHDRSWLDGGEYADRHDCRHASEWLAIARETLAILQPDNLQPSERSAVAPVRKDEPHNTKTPGPGYSLQSIRFRVAMSFPGERRGFVARVVDTLRHELGTDTVFYDHDYQAQLARPNLDTLLQGIYRNNSDLVVVFLCAGYAQKQWCGLEWRAIRDIIKTRDDERIMLIRFDDTNIDGVFSIDGYIDGNTHSESDIAQFILHRLATLPSVGSR
jgi:hypothetical protein